MTGKEIMALAWNGKEMPEGMTLPEQWLYQTMKLISWHYKQGMPQEQATAEKAEALRAFDLAVYQQQYADKMFKFWNRLSIPAGAYALNPCRETAEEFYRAVYGLPEDWRKKPELAKPWEKEDEER